MAMAYNGFVALGKESTWGTEVARTQFIRFLQAQFTDNPGWTMPPHSQSRYEHSAYPGPYESMLSATMECRSDAVGEILRSLFWADPVTTNPGTLAYEHTYTPPDQGTTPVVKPYSAELRYGTANIAQLGVGGFVDGATFQWDDRMVTTAIEMPCKSPKEVSPTAAPSYASVAPFLFQNITLTVDPDGAPTSRTIRGGSLQISNNSVKDRSSGSRFIEPPEAGAFQAQLQFSQKMTNLQDLKDLWSDDGTASEPEDFCEAFTRHVRLTFNGCEIEPGQNHELEFDLPAVMVAQPSYPLSGRDEIVESLTLQALYDDATSKVLSARLKNTTTSY